MSKILHSIFLACFAMTTANSLSQSSLSSLSITKENIAFEHSISALLDAVPKDTWDDAATSLLEKGIATVRLLPRAAGAPLSSPTTTLTKPSTPHPHSLSEIHSRAFGSARRVLDCSLSTDILATGSPTTESENHLGENDPGRPSLVLPVIPPEADSAHVSGVHRAGGMSRYNVRREGIVFSDEDCSNSGNISDLSAIFCSLHGIADRVLLALEEKLGLSENWFQHHLGPTETASQWHMKRFVGGKEEEDHGSGTTASAPLKRTQEGHEITLPMHTDPSLISVVVHHGQGSNQAELPGALGLQYFHPKTSQWEEPEAHGNAVATIFVGSVLAYLTRGMVPAAKHRVVAPVLAATEALEFDPPRMAATLFVRPQPSALLRVPLPSPWLRQTMEDATQTNPKKASGKSCVRFDDWLKRVARNYEKKKEEATKGQQK